MDGRVFRGIGGRGEGRRAASQKMAGAGRGVAIVEVTGGRAGVEKRGIQEPPWLMFCLTLICMAISRKPLTLSIWSVGMARAERSDPEVIG